MSKPPLRRPKTLKLTNVDVKVDNYVILTLKNGAKLVVSSDNFNGIINVGDGYQCILCYVNIKLHGKFKENHKQLLSHKRLLERFPHKEEFGANLIRQLDKSTCYCTICNVTMSAHMLMHHIAADGHLEELDRAAARADAYRPSDQNSNK